MTVCLRCGKQLGDTARFCGVCGYPVKRQQTTNTQIGNTVPHQPKPIVCLRCGKQLRTDAKFCGGCGYPTQRQTRNQQTTTSSQAGRQEPRQQTTANYATGNSVSPQMMTREQLIAEIDRIEKYNETNKYILYFKAGTTQKINKVGLGTKKGQAPQAPRYSSYKAIMEARSLDDIWK